MKLIVLACDFLTAYGDIDKFLLTCKEAGATAIRAFGGPVSWSTLKLYPYLQAADNGIPITFTHPTTHMTWKVWDMGLDAPKWNQAYWDRFDYCVGKVKEYELSLLLDIVDGCSWKGDKTVKYGFPMECGLHCMSDKDDLPYITPKEAASLAMPYFPGGVLGDGRRRYFQWLATEEIKHCKQIGVDLYVEPVNEFIGWIPPDDHTFSDAWYKWFTEYIISLGITSDRLVHTGATTATYPMPGLQSLHGIVRADKLAAWKPPAAVPNPGQWIISADGGSNDSGRTEGGQTGGGADAAQGLAIGQLVVQDGYAGAEHMDRGIWNPDNCQANLDKFDPAVLKAYVKGLGLPTYKKVTYCTFSNLIVGPVPPCNPASQFYIAGTEPTKICDVHIQLSICPISHKKANPYCPNPVKTWFIKGQEPTEMCITHIAVKVCSVSNKLPNPYCPSLTVKVFISGQEPTDICTVHKAPVPPAPKSCYAKYVKGKKVSKIQIGKWLLCILDLEKK